MSELPSDIELRIRIIMSLVVQIAFRILFSQTVCINIIVAFPQKSINRAANAVVQDVDGNQQRPGSCTGLFSACCRDRSSTPDLG